MALSANTDLQIQNTYGQTIISATVATGATIYKHALVVMKAAGTTCLPAANTTTTKFLGLSDAQYAAGATAKLRTNIWARIPIKTGQVSAGNYGAKMYAYDDEKCTTATTLGPVIGIHRGLSGTTHCWVELGPQTALTSGS